MTDAFAIALVAGLVFSVSFSVGRGAHWLCRLNGDYTRPLPTKERP